ncbi:MAG: methylated-DNA--[protein]-cysteine S-methyltransferase [Bacteroidetes bacterium]|nr:methylated-DNA--[protein]-cysteine S-methyltransferase [Fibrella sp.]
MVYTHYYTSPIGRLEIQADDTAILGVFFADGTKKNAPGQPASDIVPDVMRQCLVELADYFAGTRQAFTVPYRLVGSDFRRSVWQQLTQIPYGQTITYGEQARRLGNPKAVRAVGTTNSSNPISIIVPCHRVVGANGDLVGFGGGLAAKRWLLDHERQFCPPAQLSLF